MADQTVRVRNLPDSGSPERVAMELCNVIRNYEGGKHVTKDAILDLYRDCLAATQNRR